MTIKRKFEIFKYYINSEEKINKEIEKIQNEINTIDWKEENRIERIRLYQELGKVIEMYRMNRINIRWYQIKLLGNANLTG